MYPSCIHRYGPSLNKGTLKDKLFEGSKTELYYYGGQTFAAPPKSHGSKCAGKESPSARLFTPGSSDML